MSLNMRRAMDMAVSSRVGVHASENEVQEKGQRHNKKQTQRG